MEVRHEIPLNLSIVDQLRWATIVEENNLGIFYTPQYVKLDAAWSGGFPECILVEKDGDFLLYPYIKHEIKKYSPKRQYDIQTAYGYGGPLFIGSWSQEEKSAALWKIGDFLKERDIIAEFVRCDSDYYDNRVLASAGYDLRTVRTNIECDLSNDEKESYDKQAKRNIKKAHKSGLKYTCESNPSVTKIKYFEELYQITANRLKMDESYCFDMNYFKELLSIPNRVKLILAYAPDILKPIAGSILFLGSPSSFYFLGASDLKYRKFRPNDFVYSSMAIEARLFGSDKIVWGGGTGNNPDDSLFHFKKHYGDIAVPIFIACRVLNQDAYENICTRWQEAESADHVKRMKNRFLKYRF